MTLTIQVNATHNQVGTATSNNEEIGPLIFKSNHNYIISIETRNDLTWKRLLQYYHSTNKQNEPDENH